ncbi:hypothetical protein RG836_17680 [Pseudomonas sp. SZMC_28357]|uniref:hypothetical protein n=1 Tax=Pseudomonas sp. SZMC_28357 TaxID=3074380 RepID=UPI0028727853|nr:hypothetical protein [Pseudomonas sp. SZMC_28357]MDR9753282.1 hypothetical protein [Pseudomonas sp. SZMC_28357]
MSRSKGGTMIFTVMGFHPGKDELAFEKHISLSVRELGTVMQWTDEHAHVGADFRLTEKQVAEIGRLAVMFFPQGLDFYLTSSE